MPYITVMIREDWKTPTGQAMTSRRTVPMSKRRFFAYFDETQRDEMSRGNIAILSSTPRSRRVHTRCATATGTGADLFNE